MTTSHKLQPACRQGRVTSHSQKGFTIFEILLVTVLFVVISLVANQAFFSTLRGGTKSQVTTIVKENGNYAVSVMQRALLSAKNIAVSPACGPQQVYYNDFNGTTSSFACINTGASGYIASGSAQLTSNEVAVTACSITCSTTGGVPSVLFNFTLTQKAAADTARPEQSDSFQVQTQVSLRNH